jgi:hypothetical protein
MKSAVKYIAAVLTLGLAGVAYGQTPPVSVQIDSKDYYRHGYNNNTNTGTPDPCEERDSVTCNSVMKYFVLPDPFISPDYNPANAVDFSKVNSTFAWSVMYSFNRTNGSTTPIVEIEWKLPNIVDTVKVQEMPNMGAACTGTVTSIPVAVINSPMIMFNFVPPLWDLKDSACYTQAEVNAGVNVQLPTYVETKSSQVLVDYTVTKDGAAFPSLDGTNVRVANNGGTIDLTFPDYGLYEVTLTKVTDRISRKSRNKSGDPIDGMINLPKYTYRVMAPAKAGPVYRRPNRD